MTIPPPDPLRFGDLTLDLARQVLRRGGEDVFLRPKTFDVLGVLVRHAGQVVSKRQMIAAVWGDVAVTDDSLVQCLVEIRRALGDTHGVIRTVRGRGYIFEAVPPPLVGVPAPPMAPALLPIDTATATPPPSGPAGPWRWSAATATTILGVGAVLAVLLGFISREAAPGRRPLQDSMIPEARRDVDEGLALLRTSRAQVDMEGARRLFEDAVRLDAGFAAAHAALGNVLVMLSGFGAQPPHELLPDAAAAARRALALDPTLAAGWQALAHVQTQGEWDWVAAERSYRRAIALDPAAPMNMIFGHLLVGLGRIDAAVAESDRLLAIDPRSALRLSSNCIVKYLAHRPAAALDSCDRAAAVDPEFANALFFRSLALCELGRYDEAMQSALASRRGMAFAPTWLVGYVHARAGRIADAREVLRALEARAAAAYVPPVDIGLLHAAVGEVPAALDWLERGLRAHGRWMELLAVLPAADSLRGEPRFKAILRELHLQEPS